MAPGKIIFLNGTSSVGKTSIAKAFQNLIGMPYMHVSVDIFLNAVPIQYWMWESEALGTINATFAKIISGFHHSILALATAGNDLIVDHVLQESTWWIECAELLTPLQLLLVQVCAH